MGNKTKKYMGSKAIRGYRRKTKHARQAKIDSNTHRSKESPSSHSEIEYKFGLQPKIAQTHAEPKIRADAWVVKNIQRLSFMKCAKCGTTNESNPELSFYKFPCPNLGGKNISAVRCRAWAEFCWPDKVLTQEELVNVYKEKQLLCNRHFPDNKTAKQLGLKLGLPFDFLTEEKKKLRTYGKKADEKTDSNVASNNLPKHNFLKAEKGAKKSKNNLSTEEKKILEHNFLEGENVSELFETIDEVFDDRTDVSMYEETVVKLEQESLLHEGYKCDVCLSSISGYRYTCVQCADVDLCAPCEASGAHAAHYVLRIPRPRPEEEVEELLKELRNILKKRPPPDPPAEKIIIPLKRVSAAEDPLQAPAPPVLRSASQSESDEEATESESENESVPERRDITDTSSALAHSSLAPHIDLNLKANRTARNNDEIVPAPSYMTNSSSVSPHSSRTPHRDNLKDKRTARHKDEIVSSKRRKRSLYQEATATSSKVAVEQLIKPIKSSIATQTPKKDENARESNDKPVILVNTLKEKLKAVLEAALSSETVQQAKARLEAEMELTDDVKLEIDENDLGRGDDVELGENDELSDVDGIRSPGELNAGRLQETLGEEPLDFIMQMEHFNENDPLGTGVPAKAGEKTENVQKVTVKDAMRFSKRIKK